MCSQFVVSVQDVGVAQVMNLVTILFDQSVISAVVTLPFSSNSA